MVSFGDTTYVTAYPLLLYTLGIVLYGIFIFYLYRSLSKRDLISLDLHKYSTPSHPLFHKIVPIALYVYTYAVIFPLLTFIWFGVLSLFILFLSGDQSLNQILLLSMAVVASTRITSYFSEDLAKDLAKVIPFTVLGFLLINSPVISIAGITDNFSEIPLLLNKIFSYLLIVVLLEFFIRIPYSIYSLSVKQEIGEDEETPEKEE